MPEKQNPILILVIEHIVEIVIFDQGLYSKSDFSPHIFHVPFIISLFVKQLVSLV